MDQYAINKSFATTKELQNFCNSLASVDEADVMFFIEYPLLLEFVNGTNSFRLDLNSMKAEAQTVANRFPADNDFASKGTIVAMDDPIWPVDHAKRVGPDPSVSANVPDVGSHPKPVAKTATSQNTHEKTAVCQQQQQQQQKVYGNGSDKTDTMGLHDISNIPNDQTKRRRSRRHRSNRASYQEHCVFCLNNGKPSTVYQSHQCRNEDGDVTCPYLKDFVCPICAATGANAHTPKYCPRKPIITPEDCLEIEKHKRATFRTTGSGIISIINKLNAASISSRIRL